jgi:hypothetical protein
LDIKDAGSPAGGASVVGVGSFDGPQPPSNLEISPLDPESSLKMKAMEKISERTQNAARFHQIFRVSIPVFGELTMDMNTDAR